MWMKMQVRSIMTTHTQAHHIGCCVLMPAAADRVTPPTPPAAPHLLPPPAIIHKRVHQISSELIKRLNKKNYDTWMDSSIA